MDEKTKEKQTEIIEMVSAFCKDKLNDEYKHLAIKLVEKMGRKHNVPFKRGRLNIWASAVIYYLAQINLLFDAKSKYHISANDICDYFGTKKSTVSKKARLISDMYHSYQSYKEFTVVNDKVTFDSEQEVDKFFDEVKFLFSIGLAQEALTKLDTIKEDNQEYGRALLYKSIILSDLGDEDAAEDLFKESVISEVSNVNGIDKDVLRNNNFNIVLNEMNDIADSADAFNKGYEHYTAGNFEKALDLFDLSLELNPNNAEVIYYKALTLANLQDFEIALQLIDRAIELDSQEDRFWNDKANILTKIGDYSEAEKCFNKAIELNPDDSVIYANKGFMYLQQEKYKKSLENYKKAYEMDSSSIHNIVCLANVYVELYDFPEADKYFGMASRIDNMDIEYLTAMAHYMLYQEKIDESNKYWDKILEINPNQAEIWVYKSMNYMMVNNVVDAARCIEKASKINPEILDVFENEITQILDKND